MEAKFDPETDKIKVTMMLSDLDTMNSNGLNLWLTPGSTSPYWASNASFTYDKVVAVPNDFLETVGYDSFPSEDEDCEGYNSSYYEENDEALTIEVDWIDSAPYFS